MMDGGILESSSKYATSYEIKLRSANMTFQ